MHTLSVSALNEQIKHLLEESFSRVLVEGELSRITFHNSGHIYFTLKDKDSAISCVMFRGNATKLKFRLEEGLKVMVDGALTLYKPRGAYQINCFMIEPSGQGALALAYEQLKQKLMQKGYFAQERKKSLPKFPSKIALITSATGAALQDMLRVANKRYRNLTIDIYDTLVQGARAAEDIANKIALAERGGYDLIIVSRGGGSIEDLWAFNEERVADAIFAAQTPIVSAVGHEIDYLISDFVADVRAATPSAAMEIVLPDVYELLQYLDTLQNQFRGQMAQKISFKQQELTHLKNSFLQHSVERKMQEHFKTIQKLKEDFLATISFKLQNSSNELLHVKQHYPQAIESRFSLAQNQLHNLQNMLESHNPKKKITKGFAQIVKNGKPSDLQSLHSGDEFEAQTDTFVIKAKVLKKRKIL